MSRDLGSSPYKTAITIGVAIPWTGQNVRSPDAELRETVADGQSVVVQHGLPTLFVGSSENLRDGRPDSRPGTRSRKVKQSSLVCSCTGRKAEKGGEPPTRLQSCSAGGLFQRSIGFSRDYFGSDVLRPQRPDPHLAALGAFNCGHSVEEGKNCREKTSCSAARTILFPSPDSRHREPRGAPHSSSVSALSCVCVCLTPVNMQLDTRSLRSIKRSTRNLTRKPIRTLPKPS